MQSSCPRVCQAIRLLCRACVAVLDGGNLLQLLLFMHGQSKHATLAQRFLRYSLRRPSPAAAVAAAAVAGNNAQPGAAVSGSVRLLHWLAALAEAPLRHARQLLLLSVFSFRLLEWWHAPQHAPPPPARLVPPAPMPPPSKFFDGDAAGQGIRVSGSQLAHGLCGLCGKLPNEPAVAPSGFVYCGQCAHGAALQHAECPLSGVPMRVEDLRRIYETSRPPVA